jgi:hypothetical protein
MAKSPNRLLASLSSEVFSEIVPQLKTVELKFGDVVAAAGATIRRGFIFPMQASFPLWSNWTSGQ